MTARKTAASKTAVLAPAATTTPDAGAAPQTETTPGPAAVYSLEHARSLPEVPADAKVIAYEAPEGAIEQFMSEDRRTLRIVQYRGALASQAVEA